MQEKADANVDLGRQRIAQHFRHEHKVVVLDPHRVAVVDDPGNRVCKGLVDGDIGLEVALLKVDLAGQVVEQGPQDAGGSKRKRAEDGSGPRCLAGTSTGKRHCSGAYLLEKPL